MPVVGHFGAAAGSVVSAVPCSGSVGALSAVPASAAAAIASASIGKPASPLAALSTLGAAQAAATSAGTWSTPDASPYVALGGGLSGPLPLTQDSLLACMRELIAIPSISLDPSGSGSSSTNPLHTPSTGLPGAGVYAAGGAAGSGEGSSGGGGVAPVGMGSGSGAIDPLVAAAMHCGHSHSHSHHHQVPRMPATQAAGTITGSSTTRDVQACWRAAQYVHDLLVRIGAECRLVQGAPGCNPIVLGRLGGWEPGVPTICLQATYDVQPPGDLAAWESHPFQLTGRDGYLYARGATDNKGPLLAMIFAVARCWELMRQYDHQAAHASGAAGTGAPPKPRCAFVFVVEGEGENGSIGFQEAVMRNLEWLAHASLIINCNNTWIGEAVPCLTYGMRGLVKVRVEVEGPHTDLHSGLDGGVTHEPLQDLSALLGSLTDPHTGRIAVPGIYDTLAPLEPEELRLYRDVDFSVDSYMDARGLKGVFASSVSRVTRPATTGGGEAGPAATGTAAATAAASAAAVPASNSAGIGAVADASSSSSSATKSPGTAPASASSKPDTAAARMNEESGALAASASASSTAASSPAPAPAARSSEGLNRVHNDDGRLATIPASIHGPDPVDAAADALRAGRAPIHASASVVGSGSTAGRPEPSFGAVAAGSEDVAMARPHAGTATGASTTGSGAGSVGIAPAAATHREDNTGEDDEDGDDAPLDVQSALLLRRWREPAISVHGVTCSAANDSIIPCKAVGFVSVRTVPNLTSSSTFEALAKHLQKRFAARRSVNTLRVALTAHASWWLQDPAGAAFQAAARAIKKHWGRPPIFVREGGTVRVTTFLEKALGAPAIHIPIGQSSDAPHLPNERIRLLNLVNGLRVLESFFLEIAGLGAPAESAPASS